ncbi:MAG: SUF system NifU family Fe-S cluster assembly protein [Acidobacteria bacterium]|nr:MAG: SUF system NifU family Fe-S cluster assembly protein [Acidobacteriota bacterium]
MSDLDDLYQEIILDHSKRPRNFGPIEGPSSKAEGYNPLCGDRVTVQLRLENDVVKDVHFQGSGCAISMASASLMTESLKGKTKAEAEGLFQGFHELLTGEADAKPELGKLAVFSGVREYPIRVKCATLAWHTLRAALRDSEGQTRQVSTE